MATRVSNLRPLSLCSALEVLHLSNTQVSDIGPLSSCPALEILNLYNTQVSDLGSLSLCSALKELYLYCNIQVSSEDINNLRQKLTKLKIR
jgi:Leucine-rich repeat (LRR) protein